MGVIEIGNRLSILLQLKRPPVGVKLVTSEADYNTYDALEPKKPLMYCRAVQAAFHGHSIKLSRSLGGCRGSNRALGLVPADDSFWSGASGVGLGLYKDKAVAASVAANDPILPPETYGVIVKPLTAFEQSPDVILLLTNAREAMRAAQGYTYEYGLARRLNVSGNQAVCVECTVTPMQTQEYNISMLCSGTRHHARWKDDDIMIGVPFAKAEGFVGGLIGTVNAIEYDDRKREIEDGFREHGYQDIGIRYGKTYFK